jgi:hypothetical protein
MVSAVITDVVDVFGAALGALSVDVAVGVVLSGVTTAAEADKPPLTAAVKGMENLLDKSVINRLVRGVKVLVFAVDNAIDDFVDNFGVVLVSGNLL